MQFVSAGRSGAAELEGLIKQRGGLTLGALVGFFFADEDFDLASQEAANGGGASGGDYFGLPDGTAIEAKGYILLFVTVVLGHGGSSSRILRVTRILRVVKD
jgi:hypothetical protein